MSAGVGVQPRAAWLAPGVLVAAVATAPLAGHVPLRLMAVAVAVIGLVILGYVHPPAAAYLVLAVTPLLAGMERSGLVPLLRPHEAVGAVLGIGVAGRWFVDRVRGRGGWPRPTTIDVTLVVMAGAASLLPLLWMAARGLTPSADDALYAAALWKFYGLFLLIRAAVTSPRQVWHCLWISLAAGSIVAVVAMLEALQIAGVPGLLARLYPNTDPGAITVGRGTATLGSSIAVGDVMAFDLAICLGLLLWTRSARWLLLPGMVLFTVGGLASGQFSGVIALVVAAAAMVYLVAVARGAESWRPWRLLGGLAGAAVAGGVLLWPVIAARLAGFGTVTGMPQSWQVRMDNLRTLVWPQVFSGFNWLFGVRPAARIRADVPWGPYVYLESGHTWLLWTGGIPLLLAYLAFMWVALRATARLALAGAGPFAAAGTAAFAALSIVFVLMTFDPHLTMRGTADLMFSLLALASVGLRPGSAAAAAAFRRPDP